MSMHDVLLLGAAACYLGAVIGLYRSLLATADSRGLAVGLTLLGVLLHGTAQAGHWFTGGPPEISFLNALSLCALVVVLLLLVSVPFRNSVFDAGLVALPLATVILLAEWWLPPEPGILLESHTVKTAWHVVSSVLAFGVLSIAAVYALFVSLIDHFLRRHHLIRLVRALPALEVLERLLFRLISAGFVLLTVSLITGLLFVKDMFAQHLAHKTILSISAWLIFGVLLWGRQFRGWRGRTAVRLTIAGVFILVLAYFGSKLVLEVLLHRSWQV